MFSSAGILLLSLSAVTFAADEGSFPRFSRNPVTSMPAASTNETAKVPFKIQIGLNPTHLSELNPEKNEMSSNMFIVLMYKDSRLSWNPEDEGGRKSAVVPIKYIWTPDINLFNSADKDGGKLLNDGDLLAKITSDGQVIVVPSIKLKSFCNLQFTAEGHLDRLQNCSLKFGSWARDASLIDLDSYESQESFFAPNPCWSLGEVTSVKEVKKYSCCEELYGSVTFHLPFKKLDKPSAACKF